MRACSGGAIDVALLDVRTPGGGLGAAPGSGAVGFLLEDTGPRELVHAVRTAHRGEQALAPQVIRRLVQRYRCSVVERAASDRLSLLSTAERDVPAAVGEGLSNAEVGARLYLSVGTMKVSLSRVVTTLGCENRVQAAVFTGGRRQPHRCAALRPARRSGDVRPSWWCRRRDHPSSAAATLGSAHECVHHAAARAGVDALTVGLAKELADRGVRVNAVAPGMVDTRLRTEAGDPQRVERVSGRVPMGRPGQTEGIAPAIAWLLRAEAGHVTGAVLRVAGGL